MQVRISANGKKVMVSHPRLPGEEFSVPYKDGWEKVAAKEYLRLRSRNGRAFPANYTKSLMGNPMGRHNGVLDPADLFTEDGDPNGFSIQTARGWRVWG